jgi:hypothetical protein
VTVPRSYGPERRHPQRHLRRFGPTTRTFGSQRRPISARTARALGQVQLCEIGRPGLVAPIRRCLAGGHGGLDARLGALIVPVPPRGEAKPCSDGCRVTRATVWASRGGLGPSEERRPVMEPSWARRRRSRATPWRRPAATLDAGRRRSYTVSTQSRMRSSRFGWPLGEHPRYQGG